MDERDLVERLTRIENNQGIIHRDLKDAHKDLRDALKRVQDTLDRIEQEVRRHR